MTPRRPAARTRRDLTNGPGKLTQAFDIDEKAFHGRDLTAPPLYFARDETSRQPGEIQTSSRIGLSRGIDRPWRFFVAGNRFVSPGVPSDVRVARKTRRAGAGPGRAG